MIVGIGNDIVEVERIKKVALRTPAFLEKLLTINEKTRLVTGDKLQFESIAGVFAAKEAVSKALGTGFVNFEVKDIEVTKDTKGKPEIQLHGGALILARELGITHIHLSISHTKDYATAFVIAEKGNVDETCNKK
ncbi:MAG: holo-ACP synthase [Niameybacter sp.]|uniref:holo-ACP synthase n=1 Tax=Niameybacter sp. TaxID=2033640 RepID=UPI002FCB90FD